MADSPHVVVLSHERSGTHIAIDAIRNNFPAYREHFYANIDRMVPGHWNYCEPEESERDLAIRPRVVKTHITKDFHRFFDGKEEAVRVADALLGDAKLIYMYRDGRDVASSLFSFLKGSQPSFGNVSFSEFLREVVESDLSRTRFSMNALDYWVHHIEGWWGRDDVAFFSFEDFTRRFDETVARIGKHIGMEPENPVKKVVRTRKRPAWMPEPVYKLFMRRIVGVDITSVSFNKGKVGGHKVDFTEEDLA
ncbi:MAG: sulfotransferase domain-containing protein, partial [Verrucomicrobiota bacterium]